MTRKIEIPKEWLEEHYVKRELNCQQCAELLGCSDTTVECRLKDHNISFHVNVIEISREWLQENYVDRGLSSHECARLIGCSFCTILNKLRLHGLPIIRKRCPPITKAWLEEHYVEMGWRSKKCAEAIGCNNNHVLNELRKHCLPIEARPQKIHVSCEWLIDNYIKRQLSTIECAKLAGCAPSTIVEKLKLFGLSTRVNSTDRAQQRLRELVAGGLINKFGKNNPNWRGGSSFKPYCEKFDERLKECVREAFGRKCYLCPTTEAENKRKLGVHHINFDKQAGCFGKRWNLLPLCSRCHSLTNGKRYYWFNLFINHWLVNPETHFNSPEIYYDDSRSRCNSIRPSKNRPVGADIGGSDRRK